MALTPQDHARADKRTTDAWQGGERFTDELARTDLEVYAGDHFKPTVDDLAVRWKWDRDQVLDLVTRQQLAGPFARAH